MHAAWNRPMRNRRRIFATTAVFFSLLVAHAASAQKPNELADRLMRTRANTTLEVQGLSPWHMKLNVQLFDSKGKPTEEGAIEEWWLKLGTRRVVYNLPSYKATEVDQDGHLYRTRDTDSPPSVLQTLLAQAVRPMPIRYEIDQSTPSLKRSNLGKVPLDCIMLDQPIKGEDPLPLGLLPTYCLDAGKDSLRAFYQLGSETILRDGEGHFQNKVLATTIGIRQKSVKVAEERIVALETKPMTPDDFNPGDDLEDLRLSSATLGADAVAGTILNKTEVPYPQSAVQRHVQGDVVMKAIIGRDGHVRSLHLEKVPDGDLAIAALIAVREWRYTPYKINGRPVEVMTTIVVHFSLHAGV
ncbi:TonB family C-terminal domain-containing protein [Granulicella rosea]|uniref:TonB family C-terminal domain-containing protein n=1 Tax=Granulicella rosea TaxID=474952 RepID=A0A239KL37_9BACT|nr:energy transducer TonB [Granulicella rosea]SNT18881.1 TonB family C-terminal domain-containing protein [Granulicella rosea]